MHLSKQEFSKLTKAEQNRLANIKNQKKKNPQKKKSIPRSPSPKQSNVAVAYATEGKSQSAKFVKNQSANGRRIRNKEFVSSVLSQNPTDFNIALSLPLNPGISTTFPWLSLQALGWEKYRFHKLKFHFLTRQSTSQTGSVMITPDYDAADAAPSSEVRMSSYADTVECSVWKDMTCTMKSNSLAENGDRRFVRTQDLGANQDIKTYDVGTLYVATVGAPDGTNLGKLWVEYDVEFFIPQLPSTGVTSQVNAKIDGGGTKAGNNILGTLPTVNSQIQNVDVDVNSNVNLKKVGKYLIGLKGTSTGGIPSFSMTPSANAVVDGVVSEVFTTDTQQRLKEWQVTVNKLPASIRPGSSASIIDTSSLTVAGLSKSILEL